MEDQEGRNAPALGQAVGMTLAATVARVKEVRIPKWEKIEDVETYENWKHIVHTNLHRAAVVEEDAEALINRMEDAGTDVADLRVGMSIAQTLSLIHI